MASNYTECYCPCEEVETAPNTSSSAPSTLEEAQQAAKELASTLLVDPHNLSSTTRRLTSAPDERPSAKGLGTVGVTVIIVVILCVVAMDIGVLTRDVRTAVRRLTGSSSPRCSRRRRTQRQNEGRGSTRRGDNAPWRDADVRSCLTDGADQTDDFDHASNDDNTMRGVGNISRVPPGVRDIKKRRELLEMNLIHQWSGTREESCLCSKLTEEQEKYRSITGYIFVIDAGDQRCQCTLLTALKKL